MFYAYWLDDLGTGPAPCKIASDRLIFVGKSRRVCLARQGHDLRLSVSARYVADAPAWVEVALVTTRKRLHQDMKAFQAVASSFSPCRVYDKDTKTGYGEGQPCPAEGKFF